ncbi:MAG: type II toxin-antitoxin system VapC family toxin [Pirellulales bacterium]
MLDSNVVIALFDQEVAVLEQIAAAQDTIVPIPVIGELYYGAYRSRRSRPNVDRIDALVQSHTIVVVDIETARHCGVIKNQLRRKGTPIPNNDIWIAAVAQQYGATLATRDAHFDAVENLAVVRW